jgi:hypothetical protein
MSPFGRPGGATVVEGRRVRWIEADDQVEIGNGAIDVACRHECLGAPRVDTQTLLERGVYVADHRRACVYALLWIERVFLEAGVE